MTAIELGSCSSADHRFFRRCRPVFSSNRTVNWRFDPFWASERCNPRLLEERQPLQVEAGRYHRHRKVRSRLTDRAKHLVTHLIVGLKHTLAPGTGLGNMARSSRCFVAFLPAHTQQHQLGEPRLASQVPSRHTVCMARNLWCDNQAQRPPAGCHGTTRTLPCRRKLAPV